MNIVESITPFTSDKFTQDAIDEQLRKIIIDPIFVESDILRNFLVFVVRETLSGNSSQLKEYTIAVNVLDKPSSFRPQESGIVRIHASRLRRALHSYYCKNGALDKIRISIPKGAYVPVFDNNDGELLSILERGVKSTVIGVVPFRDSCNNASRVAFAEGMAVQLSAGLTSIDHLSVIAYFTMRNLFTRVNSIEEVGKLAGVQYLITGDIQRLKGKLRVHLQMIRVRTGQLAWCRMYERSFSAENLFTTQDELVRIAATEIGSLIL